MKQNRKIDFYTRPFGTNSWVYECSTTRSKTLKEAKESFCSYYGLDHSQVKVCFAPKK